MVVSALVSPAQAQVRGVYPLGMSATNSGVMPEPGLTYSNLFLFYARDQLKGPKGEILVTGQNSVMMDMNSFVWVNEMESLPPRSSTTTSPYQASRYRPA